MSSIQKKVSPALPPELRAMRLGLRLLSVVAPDAATRSATSLFLRPRRRPTRPPEVPGQVARPFQVSVGKDHVQCWSWGDGPPVLLVHGWEGHSGQLARFVPLLLDRGHRVIAFDLPAHGQSPGRTHNMAAATQTVLAVAQACGPLRGVIAHSFGASATALALAQGLKAERVALFAPSADPMLFVGRISDALGFSAQRAKRVVHHLEQRVGVQIRDLDLRLQVGRLQTPAVVFHDREDTEVPYAHAEAITQVWPGAHLSAVEGLGHWRILKDPATLARAVQFVTEANPSSFGP